MKSKQKQSKNCISHMKKLCHLIIVGIFLSLLSACTKYEVDTPNGATDLQSITGRIVDCDNNPIKNIRIKMIYNESRMFSAYTRLKAETTTDERGIFKLNIFKKEDEVLVSDDHHTSEYVIYTDIDENKYFKDHKFFFDADEIWGKRNLVLGDMVLWEAQYVTVTANSTLDNSKVYISCGYEKRVDGLSGMGLIGESLPHTLKVPKNQDLEFMVSWETGQKTTKFIKRGELPSRLDMSYVP